MKKFTSYIAMMMIALTSLTFTSCNDDEDIANTLWGVWEGEMYVTTYWGDYYYDASYSEIAFDKDPYQYASGTGYWIDYYSNAPWDYHANHIRWTISNGVIRIRYVEDGGYVDIYDYRLDYNYFTGSITNSCFNRSVLCTTFCVGFYTADGRFNVRQRISPPDDSCTAIF